MVQHGRQLMRTVTVCLPVPTPSPSPTHQAVSQPPPACRGQGWKFPPSVGLSAQVDVVIDETFSATPSNYTLDTFLQSYNLTQEQAQQQPWFANGKVCACVRASQGGRFLKKPSWRGSPPRHVGVGGDAQLVWCTLWAVWRTLWCTLLPPSINQHRLVVSSHPDMVGFSGGGVCSSPPLPPSHPPLPLDFYLYRLPAGVPRGRPAVPGPGYGLV